MVLKRYAIKIEYIGKNYHGSQTQGVNAPKTIQSELETALYTLLKTKIKTIFSGRTDAGVNARGQIVHFDADKSIVASQFISSLNGLLPDDIAVSDLKEMHADFHAQKAAKKRHYRYVFYNRKQKSAFDGDLLLIKDELDIKKMQKSLDYLLGEHDFTSFRSAKAGNPYTDCFIYKAECKKLDDLIVIDIVGNRFLYNMVRAIVGTLLLIEKDNLPPSFMKEVIEAKDRKKAGKNVNPYGLTLMKVDY